jgi:threonine synthase
MKFFEGYRCSRCSMEIPAGSVAGECPACAAPLLAVYDLGGLRRVVQREEFFSRHGGVWRFRHLLPTFGREVTLGEGSTPLIRARRLGARLGIERLYIKNEALNPTGSFKARGMAVAVTRLLDIGVREACMPSAGNAGLALSAYGAAAGIRCRIYLPDGTPAGMAEECRLYGTDVVRVPGSIADAGARLDAEAGAERAGVVSTFREPCRVEGKKTIGFEIACEIDSPSAPWVLFPTGGGTGIVAIWKAYTELETLGWLRGAKPRLAVVQSKGCAPIVRAFKAGEGEVAPWKEPETIAAGIRVPGSRAGALILAALRESEGTAVAVADADLMGAVREIASCEGVFAAPEGAATWAGCKALVGDGTIDRSDTVILVNTACGSRYRFLLEDR